VTYCYSILFVLLTNSVNYIYAQDLPELPFTNTKNGSLTMDARFLQDKIIWKKFDKFLKEIQKTTNLRRLDSIDEKVDKWKIQLETQYRDHYDLLNALVYVLGDEIRRFEDQPSYTRGRQPEPDWYRALEVDCQRLQNEKLLVQAILKQNTKDFTLWKKLIESFEFTTDIVGVSIEQFQKKIDGKEYTFSGQILDNFQEQKILYEESRNIFKQLEK